MGIMPSFDSRPVLFNYSYIQWTTNAESSSGNFQIDSVLDYLNTASNQSAQFVAPKPVPAGRMYANCDTLLKMPSYNYHLIGGKKEHTILRRPYLSGADGIPLDSTRNNSDTFSSFSWNLRYTSQFTEVSPSHLSSLTQPYPSLNVRLSYKFGPHQVRVESPLSHWNVHQPSNGWQIETGPFLWPLDISNFFESPSSGGLTFAWLHANHFGGCTIR